MAGRPKYALTDHDKLYKLREERFSWTDIAKELQVSISTLGRWVKDPRNNYTDPYIGCK